MINFVADLPVRIDEFLVPHPRRDRRPISASIIFVLTEFQVMDAETARSNELGENSHAGLQGAAARAREDPPLRRRARRRTAAPILVDEDGDDDDE